MKIENNEVSSIITKAQELGLVCQIFQNSKWKIYLKKNCLVSQTETGWLSSNKGIPEIYIHNLQLLQILEQWSK